MKEHRVHIIEADDGVILRFIEMDGENPIKEQVKVKTSRKTTKSIIESFVHNITKEINFSGE